MKVTTYKRSYKLVGWLNQDFINAEGSIEIEGKRLRLVDGYLKVDF
jgi:hypothetical protein